MAFKVKLNDASVKQVEANVRLAFEKVIANKEMLGEVGQTIVDDVRFQTRRGKSIPNDLAPLKPLSKKWKEKRKELAQSNETSDVFSPARSNLSLTGQLLNSFNYIIRGAGKLLLRFEGTHEPYKFNYREYYVRKIKAKRRINKGPITGFSNGSGLQFVNTNRQGVGTLGDRITNEKLAKYVAEDRPFVGLRPKIKERCKQIVLRYLRRSARVLSRLR